jgi:M6 family metalloprotease-like protein
MLVAKGLRITIPFVLVAMLFARPARGGVVAPMKGVDWPQSYLDQLENDPRSYEMKRAFIGLVGRSIQNRRALDRGFMTMGEVEALGGTALTGTKYMPVLIGLFNNTGSPPFPASDLQDELFDGPWATGTMTDYYDEISYGDFSVDGTVADWVTVSHDDTYYEGSSGCNGLSSGCGAKTGEFLKELLDANDATMDFSQYDNDGPDGVPNSGDDDGYVDVVAFVHPEKGGECGTSNIWSHSWVYSAWPASGGSPYETNDAAYGGGHILVDDYTIQAGRSCSGSMIQIGVFCHEFGHALGLPDLYDTDGSSSGIGDWCLMSSGSWGGDGSHPEKPSHMSAWCKMMLGWLTPTLVTSPQNVSLDQVETNSQAAKLWEDGYQGERYFLIENRQKTGFDQYLHNSGLLIWHVDSEVMSGNTNEAHKYVDLEAADGNESMDYGSNRGDAGDPFPGSYSKRTFNGVTDPNSDDYYGEDTGVACENISDSGYTMSFDATPRLLRGYTVMYDSWGNWGWGWGYSSATDIWGAVEFTTADPGTLVAMRVGFRHDDSDYTLKIYDGDMTGGTPGSLLTSQSGNAASDGYKEIALNSPQLMTGSDDFVTDVKYENKTYAIPIDGDGPADGRSWYSSNGNSYSAINNYDIDFRALIKYPDDSPPEVALESPNGGETWYVDDDHEITWAAADANGVDSVNVYYSVDGGENYTLISSGETNDGAYLWTVPDVETDSAVVKVVAFDPSLHSAADSSDAYFTIMTAPDTTAPIVEVTGPNGGETWFSGSLHDITWTASDDVGVDSVSIYYSADGGSAYALIASGEANDGVYPWTVPDTSTVAALVKVVAYDPSLNEGEDESDAVFTIIHDVDAPIVTVVDPNGGDTLQVDEVHGIRWVAYDPTYAATDDFEDGNDDGWTHWCYAATCNYTVSGGVYEIEASPGPSASTLDATDGWTDYLFETDVRIDSGTTRAIVFRYAGWDEYYKLRMLPARMVLTRYGTLSDTTLATVTGLSFSTGVWYRVSVVLTGGNIKVSVDGTPRIDVTDPDPIASGSAGLWVESGITCLFDNVLAASSYGIDSVDILYSTDGGSTFPHTIATGETNDYLYDWTVPDTPTEDAVVKIVAHDLVDNQGEDVSDAVFTIEPPPDTTDPAVAVTSPNGGETWYVGDTEDVTWTATDANGVDSVSIYYSVNSGTDWILIASQEPNDGTYPWLIPDSPTTDALVKVVAYDPSLNEGEDVSDAVFTIEPPPDTTDPVVTVLTPDKGDSLEVDSTYDITWTATDANGVDSVSIYCSFDGGGDWALIASQEPNDGVYPWTVPASPNDSAMVRVIAYDPSLNAGQDDSDSLNVIYEPTVDVAGGGGSRGNGVVLWQNSPNPFSPSTSISFYLPKEGPVFLEVFDATGRLVDVLIDGRVYGAGVSTVPWIAEDRNGAALSSGVYFYVLKTNQGVKSRKMVIAH